MAAVFVNLCYFRLKEAEGSPSRKLCVIAIYNIIITHCTLFCHTSIHWFAGGWHLYRSWFQVSMKSMVSSSEWWAVQEKWLFHQNRFGSFAFPSTQRHTPLPCCWSITVPLHVPKNDCFEKAVSALWKQRYAGERALGVGLNLRMKGKCIHTNPLPFWSMVMRQGVIHFYQPSLLLVHS